MDVLASANRQRLSSEMSRTWLNATCEDANTWSPREQQTVSDLQKFCRTEEEEQSRSWSLQIMRNLVKCPGNHSTLNTMIFCDGGNPETLNQMHPVKRRLNSHLLGLLVLITVQMRELAVVRPWVLTASQTSGAAQRSHLAAIPEFKCCSASLHFRLAVYMPPYSVNVVIL